jgi:hypothetical protein
MNHKKLPYSKRFFSMTHSAIKHATIIANMIDRKLARAEVRQIDKTLSKDKIILRNAKFNNFHKGKRCFVIANGPSLKKQDLSLLKNEITIGTNTIWKHSEMKNWNPTYYCTAHIECISKTQKDLGYAGKKETIEDGMEFFKNVRDILHDSIYFIPYYGYDGNKNSEFLPEDRTFYIPQFPYPLFEMLPEFPNLAHGFPNPQDSSQYAIMIAVAMGCSPIYLLGCDHDWFVNHGPEQLFFDKPASENAIYDTGRVPMMQTSWFNWLLWRSHDALNKMAIKNGVEIFNATGGGILDIYPLKKYEDLFNSQNKS